MSSGQNIAIPLKGDQPGFLLPEDGGTYIVDGISQKTGLTNFYQQQFGIDHYLNLPEGKTEIDFLTFVADQFQLQGVTLGSCDKMESHGGFSSGTGSLKTCTIGHYSEFCPKGNFSTCHQHLINPFSDSYLISEVQNSLNLVQMQMMKLSRKITNGIPAHLTLGGLYKYNAIDDTVETADGTRVFNRPSGVSDKEWNGFKKELSAGCDGWLSKFESDCQIFDKEELKKCKNATERANYYDEAFTKLQCCAQEKKLLNLALGYDLQDDNTGEELTPYIRVTKSIWNDLNAVVRNNVAKQENGCTNVCNSFTFEMMGDTNRRKVIYWNGYLLAVDEGLCYWDNVLGGTTYGAWFTTKKNIQFTAGWEYLTQNIPTDYVEGQRAGDYGRPVLMFKKKNTDFNCGEWQVKMTMRIGAGICEKDLIVGDYVIV